jgi:hypothetical protein
MPQVEGRLLKRPVVAEVYVGERIVLRIDDLANPEFWATLSFTPQEWSHITNRYVDWLGQTEQLEALEAMERAIG